MSISQRILAACLVGTLLLSACAPRHYVFSVEPVDARGFPLPFDAVVSVRFEDGGQQAISDEVELRVADGRLQTSDGQSWPLSSIDAVDWRDAGGDLRRTKLQSPEDLLDFEDFPRLRSIRTRGGERIDFEDDVSWSRWSEDQLAIEFSPDGGAMRSLALDEIHTVELDSTSILDATITDWRFYAALAAAATIIWLVRPDTEELAIR